MAKKKAKKKSVKKKAKKLIKKAEKVAKTKSGRIGIGAGAGALLLGPIGAVGGALYGASTGKRKKKNPGYELNPRGKKKKFTWTKKRITPGGLSSDGVAYLTPRIVRGETLKWVILKNRKRWHTYLIDGYTGDILGKQGAGSTTLAAAKAKAVDIKVTKMPKGTKYKKEKRKKNPSIWDSEATAQEEALISKWMRKYPKSNVSRKNFLATLRWYLQIVTPYDQFVAPGADPQSMVGSLSYSFGRNDQSVPDWLKGVSNGIGGRWKEEYLEGLRDGGHPARNPKKKNPEPTLHFSKTWAKMLLLCCGSDPGDKSKFTPIDLFGYKVLQGEEVPLSLVIDTKGELERLGAMQTDPGIKEEIEGFVEGLEFLISKQVNPARAFSLETEVKRGRQKKAKKAALSSVAAESGARSARAESVRRTLASLNPGKGMPKEVRAVVKTAQANEARGSESEGLEPYPERVYVRLQTADLWDEGDEKYWEIADNLEQMGTLGYYRLKDEKWYYPPKWPGSHLKVGNKMPDGFREAQANAEIWFSDIPERNPRKRPKPNAGRKEAALRRMAGNPGESLSAYQGKLERLSDTALGAEHRKLSRLLKGSKDPVRDFGTEGLPMLERMIGLTAAEKERRRSGNPTSPHLTKSRKAWEKYCANPTKRGIQACHKWFEKGIKHADLEVRKECRKGMRACRLEMREWGLKPNPSYHEAMGMEVTKAEAIREIMKHRDAHGMSRREATKAFFADVGEKDEYEGEEVLGWLGY